MRNILKKIVILALVIAALCSCAQAASYDAQVLSRTMLVYNGNKQVAGALKQKTDITVTAISGDWARIRYDGRTGYAKLKDIIFDDEISAVVQKETSIRFVTRKSFSQNTYYSATILPGTEVYVAGFNGREVLVTNGDGSALGYVSRSALAKQ